MDDISRQSVCLSKNYNEGIRLLAELVADKEVVGVGESTHGTHEFFQLKADLVCELITKHDFHTIALEDESDGCDAINAFIQTGKGNLDELIQPLYSVWRTEEVKDLIVRLKNLASSYSIQFVGVDVDSSKLTKESGKPMFEQRDRLMADNVLSVLDKGKTFVWAHNSHVSRRHLDVRNLGRNLAKDLGRKYAAVGQFFGRGSFSVKIIPEKDMETYQSFKHIPLSPLKVPAPKAGFLEEVLDKPYCQSYFIDLSNRDKIEVLDREYKSRAFGAVSSIAGVDKWPMRTQPYICYDFLIYFKTARHTETIRL